MIHYSDFFSTGFGRVWLEKSEFQEAQKENVKTSEKRDETTSARKNIDSLQSARSSVSRMPGLTEKEKGNVLSDAQIPSLPDSNSASDNLRLKFEVGKHLDHYRNTYNAEVDPQAIIEAIEPTTRQVSRSNPVMGVTGLTDFETEEKVEADFQNNIDLRFVLGGNKSETFRVSRSELELPLAESLFNKIEEWLKKTTGYDPEKDRRNAPQARNVSEPRRPTEKTIPKIKPDVTPTTTVANTANKAKQSIAESNTRPVSK